MPKQKHESVIEVTVILRKPYEQNNLAAALEMQNVMLADAKKLAGYVSASVRMTKAPAAAAAAAAAAGAAAAEDPLAIPAVLKR